MWLICMEMQRTRINYKLHLMMETLLAGMIGLICKAHTTEAIMMPTRGNLGALPTHSHDHNWQYIIGFHNGRNAEPEGHWGYITQEDCPSGNTKEYCAGYAGGCNAAQRRDGRRLGVSVVVVIVVLVAVVTTTTITVVIVVRYE
jgi:hypothetical protein